MTTEGQLYASALGSRAESSEPEAPPPLVRIIEALLFASGQPLTAATAAGVVRGLGPGEFRAAVEELARTFRRQNRPFVVQETAHGWVLTLRPRFRELRERLDGAPREARLSKAGVEVLALIAFRQPTSRADIDSQRGSDSAALVRQLVRLGLVAQSNDGACSTTPRFLELFNLKSLDDLPLTMDLEQI